MGRVKIVVGVVAGVTAALAGCRTAGILEVTIDDDRGIRCDVHYDRDDDRPEFRRRPYKIQECSSRSEWRVIEDEIPLTCERDDPDLICTGHYTVIAPTEPAEPEVFRLRIQGD